MTPSAARSDRVFSKLETDVGASRLRRMAWLCAALVLAITLLSAWLRLAK